MGIDKAFLDGLADLAAPYLASIGLPTTLKAAFPQLPANEIPKCGYLTPNGSLVTCSEKGKHTTIEHGNPGLLVLM